MSQTEETREGFYLSEDGEWIPEGWRAFKISEMLNFENHRRIPLSAAERKDRKGKYPYYGASGIFDHLNEFIFSGEHLLISEDGENLLSRKQPIAFNVDGEFWVNNHAHILSSGHSHRLYLLEKYISQLDVSPYVTGAAQPKLSKGSLERIPFILPVGVEEQKAIASVLGSLDDKIELLREQNETLEALAQTLFKRWFIDFNFPDENGNPYKDSGGKMIASELGEIPEGWNVHNIGDYISISGGGTPSTKEPSYWDGDIAWSSPKDLSERPYPYLMHTNKTITEDGLKKITSGINPVGSLLLSSRAPIGYIALSEIPVAVNQGYIVFATDSVLSNQFMYLWLKKYMNKVINAANGSTFLEISKKAFNQIETITPKISTLDSFQTLIMPHFEKLKINQTQIQTLTNLRDTLLPKLMKGEIRIKNL